MTDMIRNNREEVVKNIKRNAKIAFIMVIVLAVVAIVFYFKGYYGFAAKGDDKHSSQVSTIVIEERLVDAAKLVAQEFNYTNVKRVDNIKTLWGHDVGITEHSVEMTYSGKINVAFDLSQAKVKVLGKKIYIKLPEPMVTDNYIDIDSLVVRKDNNIFNPIKDEEIQQALKEAEGEELDRALNAGINDRAVEHAKNVIIGLFIDLDDYTIQFI